jgi:hypothetical protein
MAKHKPHPIAQLFPEMTPDLKKDLEERMAKGLPLEHPVRLYQGGTILDGRDKAWRELGNEGDPPIQP